MRRIKPRVPVKPRFTLIAVAAATVLLRHSSVCGATFNIANGDVAGLKSAITAANSNGADDTIELAASGNYTLTARDSFLNGLPQLGSDGGHKLTIHGNGASIARSSAGGTQAFRIFETKSGANVTLTGLTLTNGNLASGTFAHGGAIYNNGDEATNATLTIANCTITNCSGDYGGAIYNDGSVSPSSATLIITNSTFSGNFSINNGGAIYNDGSSSGSATLAVSGSAFIGNSNSHNGGGAIQHDGSSGSVTGSIINSTFSQNSSVGNGGCIYMDGDTGSASLNVSNCTLSDNSAAIGGALYINSGGGGTATLQMGNTIVEAGAVGVNIGNNGGTFVSLGYNLSDDAAGGPAGTAPGGFLNHSGDQRNTDPLTDPAGVKNNGGATVTLALRATSPAIDHGKSNTISSSSNDERGEPRPFDDPNVANASGGDASDIGAYEADVRLISEQRVGNDLTFTFMTIVDHTYEVQGRTSLTSGLWSTVSGTNPPPPIAGTGGPVQVTIPNALIAPGGGFYRAHQLP
jgi:predicted outer membrane repeat protein